ncbi:MAG: hypothetical protein R3356_01940 [Eudoraea sp.]|nr:hypothetical protein [Eudoraea sp.]
MTDNKPEILPCNIMSTPGDVNQAERILKNTDNYIVRYLRKAPTVGIADVPVRHADGSVLKDVPPVRQRVICSGVPYACMIAFMEQDNLYIGWSKRIEERKLIETPDLHGLFRQILEDTQGVTEDSADYQDTFDVFCNKLISVLSYSPKKDVEISFSKKAGKIAAVVRGLKDTIASKGSLMTSEASGVVPNEIAKNLGQFIDYAEKVYGSKAVNVSRPELVPSTQPEAGLAAAVAG